MSQARGIDLIVGLYEETSYGQDPSPASGQKLYVTKFDVKSAQNLIDDPTLTGDRSLARPTNGNIDVAGSVDCVLSAQSIGTLLKHALGSDTPSGGGPYTHLLKIADLPVALTLEKDHGSKISGTGRFERFNGCRIAKVDFDFPTEGYCTASFSVKGAKSTLAASGLDATLTDNGHTGFSSFSGAIEEGGSPIATVISAKISLDNDIDDSIYAIGGQGTRRALPEGFSKISGEVTALFEDATLLQKAIAGTQTSLKVTLSRGTGAGSAGNESIEFLLNQVLYERTSPGIDGPRGVLITLPFKGFRSSDGSDLGLQVTVKNAVATV